MDITVKHIIALDEKTRQLLYIIVGILVLFVIIYAISLMTLPSNIAHAMYQANIGSVQGQVTGEHNIVNQYYS
jgi:hypothetical protein